MHKYHIITHETTQYYTLIEAKTEQEAKNIALEKGGTWIMVPKAVHHEVVTVLHDSIPHMTESDTQFNYLDRKKES